MATGYAPLIIGNWKMNGTKASGVALVNKLHEAKGKGGNSEMVLCPPCTLLTTISALANGVLALGAQDCHDQVAGAYTGNISAEMLKDAGCSYVILGHSERRSYHQESDEAVKKKASAALSAGLIPVICIGESAEDRKAGNTLQVLKKQLHKSVPEQVLPENTVIAYEPLWAIGTGNIPSLQEIEDVHHFIADEMRQKFQASFRILYGGSVKPTNAGDILSINHVGGLLVGGCSLSADDFIMIMNMADHIDREKSTERAFSHPSL